MTSTATARLAASELPSTGQRIADCVSRFVAWLDRHGETSYDHQSYFAGPIGGRAKALYYRQRWLGTVAVAPMVFSEAFLPSARRLFWKPQRFPIADAHYAMGFAHRFRETGDEGDLRRAVHFLDVLEATRSPGYDRHAWGYPFDWVTRTGVMRAGTPLITTTPYVYEAFLALDGIGGVDGIEGERRRLETMRSIARHALHDIPVRRIDARSSCAGYNPHDVDGCVVNASAYRSFLLMHAAHRFSDADCRDAALRNLRYVLASQRRDGSWPYATDGVRNFVDHFHTCFVLKALAKIQALEADEEVASALDAGVRYYVEHLFDERGLPRPFALRPRVTVYRQELYDYAECINLGALLAGRHPGLAERARDALDDVLGRWQKADGSFRSRRLILGWDDVPMHRWAQAQMFRSLCLLLGAHGRPKAPVGTAADAVRFRPGPHPASAHP